MSAPFILWNQTRRATRTSDDAGTSIEKYALPPAVQRGPYETPERIQSTSQGLRYVPPLTYFCIKVLSAYPDQLNVLGPTRLQYRSPESPKSFDILRALIPPSSSSSDIDPHNPYSFDISSLDPRVWSTLAQTFSPLPTWLHTISLPLSDIHLPLLQRIPSGPNFSLVTILELPHCEELCDETIGVLVRLTSLVALDVRGTSLGTYGIRVLLRGLGWREEDDENRECPYPKKHLSRRGPWGLRIMRLQKCHNIDNGVFALLPQFPLLCAVDLRETSCDSQVRPHSPHQFYPTGDEALFHPVPLRQALSTLENTAERLGISLYSASRESTFKVHVDSLHHKPWHSDTVGRNEGARHAAHPSIFHVRSEGPMQPWVQREQVRRMQPKERAFYGGDYPDNYYDDPGESGYEYDSYHEDTSDSDDNLTEEEHFSESASEEGLSEDEDGISDNENSEILPLSENAHISYSQSTIPLLSIPAVTTSLQHTAAQSSPATSSSGPSLQTEPTTEEHDSHNIIAALEASLTTAHTAVERFYLPLNHRPQGKSKTLPKQYASFSRHSFDVDPLLLIRPPPPITALDDPGSGPPQPAPIRASGRLEHATLKQDGGENAKRLFDMVASKRRRTSTNVGQSRENTQHGSRLPSGFSTTSKARNPFSVKNRPQTTGSISSPAPSIASRFQATSSQGKVLIPERQNISAHASVPKHETKFDHHTSKLKSTVKALKPITTLPVPILPPEYQANHSSNSGKAERSKPIVAQKRKKEVQSTLSLSTRASREEKPLGGKDSIDQSAIRGEKGHLKANGGRAPQAAVGFNWKNWSRATPKS